MRRKLKAFTLIELLVVIAIIGILAALIITSLTGARLRSSDAQIKSGLHSLSLTLEQYRTDSTASIYPLTLAQIPSSCSPGCGFTVANAPSLVNALSPLYSAGTASSAFTSYRSVTVGYKTNITGTSYAAAAGLQNTTETVFNGNTNSANGEYCTDSNGVANGTLVANTCSGGTAGALYVNSLALTGINSGTNNSNGHAWVVYGPQ